MQRSSTPNSWDESGGDSGTGEVTVTLANSDVRELDLDPDFASHGMEVVDDAYNFTDIVVQPDGKILATPTSRTPRTGWT